MIVTWIEKDRYTPIEQLVHSGLLTFGIYYQSSYICISVNDICMQLGYYMCMISLLSS